MLFFFIMPHLFALYLTYDILDFGIKKIYEGVIGNNYGRIRVVEGHLEFKGDNILLSLPNCKTTTTGPTYFHNSNCSVMALINAKVIIMGEYSIEMEDFLLELMFSKMNYESVTHQVIVKTDYHSCNFNRKNSKLSSLTILEPFERLMQVVSASIANSYQGNLIAKSGMLVAGTLMGDFKAVFNYLSMIGPFYYDGIDKEEDLPEQITFYSFKPAIFEEPLAIKEKLFMKKVIVPFEYSIDCDLNYKEGTVTIDIVTMTLQDIYPNKITVALESSDTSKKAMDFIFVNFQKRLKEALQVYRTRLV